MPILSVYKEHKFEIQLHECPPNIEELLENHVVFSGSPVMHPHEEEKVLLITDPFSTHSSYLEFRTRDIGYVEELSRIVNLEGISVALVRLWVRKMSIGVRLTPFLVGDTRNWY